MVDALDKNKENVEKALILLDNLFNRLEWVDKSSGYKLQGVVTRHEYNSLMLARNFIAERLNRKVRI